MARVKRDPSSLPALDPKRVEYYRYCREWTVGEFQERALLTDEGLQKIRQGRPISMEKARKVAAACGVPLMEILDLKQRLQLMPEMRPETSSNGLPDSQS